MHTRSVNNRIAVNFNTLDIPIKAERALEILEKKRIRKADVDIVDLAECLVGKAQWKLPSRQWEAPYFFDCSSLTKWLYGQKGIWIPRRSLQQFEFVHEYGLTTTVENVTPGDLLFLSSPYKNGVRTETDNEIGHVCFVSSDGNAISATNSEFGKGVIKLPITTFLSTRRLATIGRIVPSWDDITTLIFPPDSDIEIDDDIRHLVLQSL